MKKKNYKEYCGGIKAMLKRESQLFHHQVTITRKPTTGEMVN